MNTEKLVGYALALGCITSGGGLVVDALPTHISARSDEIMGGPDSNTDDIYLGLTVIGIVGIAVGAGAGIKINRQPEIVNNKSTYSTNPL